MELTRSLFSDMPSEGSSARWSLTSAWGSARQSETRLLTRSVPCWMSVSKSAAEECP